MPISSPTMLAPRSGPQPEDRERHQRITLASLDRHERDQQHHGRGQADDRSGRAPADVDRVDDGVYEQRQPGGDGHRSGDVERVAGLFAAALAQDARGQRGGDQPDRDVDEQHPAPVQPAGQDPAQQDPGGAAGPGDRAPDAERAVALGPVGERGGDDRQCGGGDDRGAQALDRASDDQPCLGLRQAAGQRGQREDDQSEHEHAASPQQVGHPPAQQQKAAERQRVGIHDPGQVVAGEVQVSADRRQRDVHDRRVDHDHELHHRQQREREILGAGCKRGHRLIPSIRPTPDSDAKANRCTREVRIAVGWALNSIAT